MSHEMTFDFEDTTKVREIFRIVRSIYDECQFIPITDTIPGTEFNYFEFTHQYNRFNLLKRQIKNNKK